MTERTWTEARVHAARAGERNLVAEDLWKIPRVGAFAPSPDGARVAIVATTFDLEENKGRGRIWLVPSTPGDPVPLTAAAHDSGEPAFSPDGSRLAFTRKDGEKRQLFVMPLAGGEPERVTEMPLGVFDPTWLPDGTGIVFGTKLLKGHLTPDATKAELERREKDPVKAHVTEDRVFRYWDAWLTTGEVPHLFLLDLATKQLRDLTPESTLWFDFMDPSGQYDVSPDGREIAFAATYEDKTLNRLREGIFVAPVAGGTVVNLLPDHLAGVRPPRYSRDGKSIVYGTTVEPFFYADRVRLHRYDRAAAKHAPLLVDWELSPATYEMTPNGTFVIEAERDARHGLFVWDGKSPAPRQLVAEGTVGGARPSGADGIVFSMNTMSQPTELFGCDVAGTTVSRLTRFTDTAMSGVRLGETREIRFVGGKGERVQMYVVLPPGFDKSKKWPLVHVIHGGPHGISGDNFHPRWNAHLFAAPGYVVAMVNFQGSTSWGNDFAQRIQGEWGDRPFEDVMRATDVMIETGFVDETRMAATGASYGGYMIAWIAGHTTRFKCLVNHAGVFDSWSQYASDITQGRHQAFGGEPWDRTENLDRWNPVRASGAYATPMLVVHGEMDYRVPVAQGLFCYAVLKARNIPARLVHFPDENHWVLKPRNSVFWYGEVMGWITRWIGA
jgi:dipeptidyl aminopeptidase/acylaminoacyl peptidase